MARIQVNRDLLITGDMLNLPRLHAEQKKIKEFFPQFKLLGNKNEIKSAKGWLRTNSGKKYWIKIQIDDDYPYCLPSIKVLKFTLPSNCPHTFGDNKICVMKDDQWFSSYSLAFLISKAAIWLNKFDRWQIHGQWKGNEQNH